ncbi:MAG TPA: NAD-binding protein [Thermoplasmata archaeon]|nr:NAD-binding protein [Thermoplasmata archaeon]
MTSEEPGAGSGSTDEIAPPSFRTLVRERGRTLTFATAGTGFFLVIMGFLSAILVTPDFYRDSLAGYDPPVDALMGVLLLALSFRIGEQSIVAWFFSLLAPILTVLIAVFSPNVFSLASAVAATALVALILPYRGGLYRGPITGPASTQLMVMVAAILSLLFGMVGAQYLGDQFSPSVHGWSTSLYFTITTISTNGSGFSPTSDGARYFVVVLILLGVGTFLSAVVVLFQPFLERRLERIAQRLQRAQMEELNDHIIVCGASTTARAAAEALRDSGVAAVILSPDARAVERLRAEGFATELGESSSEDDLRAVGITRARALVAADDSDAENLLTVITARGIEGRLRIVAVATIPGNVSKLRKAGANEAISAIAVAAKLVSAAALGPSAPRDRAGLMRT